jgi:hypothetical protein
MKIIFDSFRKNSKIKFHENLSNGSPFVACGRTGATKLTVSFRNFVKELKTSEGLAPTIFNQEDRHPPHIYHPESQICSLLFYTNILIM